MRNIKVDITVNFMVEVPEGTKTDDLYIDLTKELISVRDAKGKEVGTPSDYYTDEVIAQNDTIVQE